MSDDARSDERIAALEREVAELRELLEAVQTRPGWPPQRMANTGNGMCDRCRIAVERGEAAVCGCVLYGPKSTCAAFRAAVQAVVVDSARFAYPNSGTSARM